jgi:hypothetical protein
MERVTTRQQQEGGARGQADGRGLRLLFSSAEVCRVTGLSRDTLRHWTSRVTAHGGRWVEPAVRGGPGAGCGHQFTGWQLAGFAVVAGCLRSSRFAGCYVGKHGVVAAMQGLADRDDALLLPPDVQDPYVQEAAARIASAAISTDDLPAEARENLVCVVHAVYEKATVMVRS